MQVYCDFIMAYWSNTLRKTNLIYSVICLLSAFAVNAIAEQIPSLNNVSLTDLQDNPQYNFWVNGHIIGHDHRANQSVFPNAGFLANLDLFNASEAKFIAMLGDSFNRITPAHTDAMRQTLGKLTMPALNAMGKREHAQRAEYQASFGDVSQYDFMIGPDVFIVVDCLSKNWDWLKDRLKTIAQTPALRNIFILGSTMPWGQNDDLLPSVPQRRPSQASITLPSQQAFNEQIKPLLIHLAEIKSVYWFAGNLDRSHIHNCFYWKDQNRSLNIIATSMTGSANDTMINVQIDHYGVVHLRPMSMSNGTIFDINQFALTTWQADTHQWRNDHPLPTFTQRFKSKSKEVLLSKKFHAGVLGGIIVGGILLMRRKRPRILRPQQHQALPQNVEVNTSPTDDKVAESSKQAA